MRDFKLTRAYKRVETWNLLRDFLLRYVTAGAVVPVYDLLSTKNAMKPICVIHKEFLSF